MPGPSSIVVEGADRLRATLTEAARNLEDFTRPGMKAARSAAGLARGIAPRRTGALAGTITASASKRVGIIRAGDGLDYGRPVHWGSPARNIPARPFLSQAAQASEGSWVGAYMDHIDENLSTVKGK